jgi:hypothetical protein
MVGMLLLLCRIWIKDDQKAVAFLVEKKNMPAVLVEGAGTGRESNLNSCRGPFPFAFWAGDFLRDLRDLWVEAYMKKE